jgi:hypothetical protein
LLSEKPKSPVELHVTSSGTVADLGRPLRTLSSFLRDDARTRAELETRQGWVVNAARLAVAAPWLLLGLLSLQTESVRAYNAPRRWPGVAVTGVARAGFNAASTAPPSLAACSKISSE